jgi:hypothetical protein
VMGIDVIDKFVWILSETIDNDRTAELGKQIDGLKEEQTQMINEIDYLLKIDSKHNYS